MEYIATFSLAFDATDDESAARIAHEHNEQFRDALLHDAAHTSRYLALEHVVAIEAVGARTLPQSQLDSRPLS